MLESILSKTVLIAVSMIILITSGSILSSHYIEQEVDELSTSFHQLVGILRQTDSFDGECSVRLDMGRFLGPGSTFMVGNGSAILFSDGRSLCADLSGGSPIRVLGRDGTEATVLELSEGDVMVIERIWDDGSLRTLVYIENVAASFPTASTNLSTSSAVL